ncbi:MauE/DoxX family redox-associated membrane protein [Flavobacterium lindanitolerans]|uniref:MauE/DoxX family redox-associated membrane protein n=1 Tax=Flavobacterium lindanitolerans TaxID=428988 RepID=UPI0023F50021|nr:MauE/DoxX family redox-associated membrane protein [Flavobacterium lindanitolerans]
MRNRKIFTDLTVALLIVLFLHTSLSKFLDFKGFVFDLNNQPFPNSYTPFLSCFIPSVEIAIVLGLLFEKTRGIALFASLFLMVAFTIYTSLVLLGFFDYVPCSCGGVVSYLNWTQHFFFNLFFVAITTAAILFRNNKNSDNLTFYGTEK